MKYLDKLEFNKIQKILSNYCHTYLGKQTVQNLTPCFSKDEVSNMLATTQEAINIIYQNAAPSIYEIADITITLKKLEQGACLSIRNLLDLANILKLSQELKEYFQKDYIKQDVYPILSNTFSNLYGNKSITDRIFSCILDENTLDDLSSSNLNTIL